MFGLSTGWLFGIVGGGALLIGIAGGWTVRDWKADSDQLAALNNATKKFEKDLDTWNKLSTDFENTRNDLDNLSFNRQNTIREIYKDVKVPSDCEPVPDAIGVLKSAVDTANAARTGKFDGGLPTDTPSAKPVH